MTEPVPMDSPARPPSQRRITLQMYITLDGYNEFPTYPGSGDPPPEENGLLSEEMWNKRWASTDSLLFDRETYEQWAEFWPVAKRTPEEHPWYRRMSEFAERAQKVVLSAPAAPTSWANTRFIPGDLGAAITQLQREPGKHLAVVAPALGMELIRRGLIDDYFFAIFPVILGKGHRFFEEAASQQTLHLVEVKQAKAGELFLHYRVER